MIWMLSALLMNAGASGLWEELAKHAYPLTKGPSCQSAPSEEKRKNIKPKENEILKSLAEKRLKTYDCTEKYLYGLLNSQQNFSQYTELVADTLDTWLNAEKKLREMTVNDPRRSAQEDLAEKLRESLKLLPFGDSPGFESALNHYEYAFAPDKRASTVRVDPDRAKERLMADLRTVLNQTGRRLQEDKKHLQDALTNGPAAIGRADRNSLVHEAIGENYKTPADPESQMAFCHLRKKHGEGADAVDHAVFGVSLISLGAGRLIKFAAGRVAPLLSRPGFSTAGIGLRTVGYGALNSKFIEETCFKKFKSAGVTSPEDQDSRECRLHGAADMDAFACVMSALFATVQVKASGGEFNSIMSSFMAKRGYSNFLPAARPSTVNPPPSDGIH